jgi:Rha family phage regulatory protein
MPKNSLAVVLRPPRPSLTKRYVGGSEMAENTVSQNSLTVKVSGTISIEFVGENVPTVLSTEVALRFQKKHKHILDEIKRILSITPKSFSGPNFRPAEYTDEQGKPRPAYRLTRDAFSLLAMGFTGAAAIRWKLKYILQSRENISSTKV